MRPALSVASECAPLVKTGGLADVVGALPAALQPEGWALRTLLPGYRAVLAQCDGAAPVLWLDDLFGGPARVLAVTLGGLDLLILDAPHLFDREGSPYLDASGNDWVDNDLRFAALSFVGAQIAAEGLGGWQPELVHLHDWQAALVPEYLRSYAHDVPTILTIHNIAFHGLTGYERLAAMRLDPERFTPEGFEYYGHISALKAGLMGATKLTTVSPSYARELETPAFGMGLDGVIRSRRADLSGILNGIDTAVWNPETDPMIRPFRTPRGKAANRAALCADFGLSPDVPGPLAVVVSRLSGQKGLDLLLDALPALTDRGGQLALLGAGARPLENAWLAAARDMPGVSVRIGYDEALSHRMYAGADAVLVPSRFEPCGLTQLYALRYGAVPVVAQTGGLADTVIHANDAALRRGVATGLTHAPGDAAALRHALTHLCDLYATPGIWTTLQRNAMKQPVDWTASSPQYARLYNNLTGSA
nr:glycogen synthase GlgA [Roseicitreum antarcticum]